MKVSMDLLKQLRDMTFAPMKDCKDALVEADGDLDKAAEILKEKWILKAGKKADRETSEGLIKLVQDGDWFAGVKLLCETDFVAKNEIFHELLDLLIKKVLDSQTSFDSIEDLDEGFLADINTTIAEFVWKIGENVQLGDVISSNKNVYIYNHPGNKVAAVIYYDGGNVDTAKEVALQVVAMNPSYLSLDSVDKNYYNELKAQFGAELLELGKPKNMIDQILQWKINKALSELTLLEQSYIRDGSKKLKEIFPEGFEVKKYIRLAI